MSVNSDSSNNQSFSLFYEETSVESWKQCPEQQETRIEKAKILWGSLFNKCKWSNGMPKQLFLVQGGGLQ